MSTLPHVFLFRCIGYITLFKFLLHGSIELLPLSQRCERTRPLGFVHVHMQVSGQNPLCSNWQALYIILFILFADWTESLEYVCVCVHTLTVI